jgi:hypothetical protein
MKLTNPGSAVVDPRKVTDYLLNAGHPDNGGKAAFFEALGFTRGNPDALVEALRTAVGNEVVRRMETAHGEKYVIDAPLAGSSGRVGQVRTVWIVDRGLTTPRFVTAYPRE